MILTVTLEALVDEAVEQRAAVVAERWTAVRVQAKLVKVLRLQDANNNTVLR